MIDWDSTIVLQANCYPFLPILVLQSRITLWKDPSKTGWNIELTEGNDLSFALWCYSKFCLLTVRVKLDFSFSDTYKAITTTMIFLFYSICTLFSRSTKQLYFLLLWPFLKIVFLLSKTLQSGICTHLIVWLDVFRH